jgi:hypothetical protein
MGEQYGEAISAFDPELFEEIRGVAEGSGYGLAEILALLSRPVSGPFQPRNT